MLRYITDKPELVAAAVAKAIPHMFGRGFGKCSAIGVQDKDGRLIAGIVYHSWNPELGVIEMSMAALPGTRWLTRETLRRMYSYPFEELGCQQVFSWQYADAERNLRQLAAYNYSFIRVPRMCGRNRDAVLCLLSDDAWRANKFNRDRKLELEEAA
jgi:RimJ/RimL family protein N-acetyltransferase